MTEYSEYNNYNNNDSFTNKSTDSTDSQSDDLKNKFLIFRCEKCHKSTFLKEYDPKTNKFIIKCKNNDSYVYNSFDEMKEKVIKNLNKVFCNSCRKEMSNKNKYECDSCNKIFCEECHNKHREEESGHIQFYEFSPDKINYKTQIQETNKNISKITQTLKEFKNAFNKKIDCLLNRINDYSKVSGILSNYSTVFEDFNTDNDFNSNTKLFSEKMISLNNYFERWNNFKSDDDFEKQTRECIKLIEDYEKIDFEKKEEKAEIPLEQDLKKKIGDMETLKINGYLAAKSFCPFNNGKYMIFGLKSGDIMISEKIKKDNFQLKLKISGFSEQVEHICELDKTLIVATDGRTSIKIIRLEDDLSKYTIIQTIYLKDETGLVYSMIPLKKLSKEKNCYYFSTSDDNKISIYKSTQEPELRFELEKEIILNTLIHSLIEVNEKYIVAACTQNNRIKIFDTRKNFGEVGEIKGYTLSKGSNIFTLIPENNMLIVGCKDGFILINTIKMKVYKKIHCKYNVLCLDMLSKNTLVCCTYEENDTRIRQYALEDKNFQFSKISEKRIKSNYNIWKIQKVNQNLFFIDNQSKINYLE